MAVTDIRISPSFNTVIFREIIAFTALTKRKLVRPSWEQERTIKIEIYINIYISGTSIVPWRGARRASTGCALTHNTVPDHSWVLVAASRHSKGVAQAQVSPVGAVIEGGWREATGHPLKGPSWQQNQRPTHLGGNPGLASNKAAGYRVGWRSPLRLLRALGTLWVLWEFVGGFSL